MLDTSFHDRRVLNAVMRLPTLPRVEDYIRGGAREGPQIISYLG